MNLAALENRVKKDKKQNRKTSAVEAKLKAVKGVQAANLLAAREQISDAYWDPGQRAKVRRGIARLGLCTHRLTSHAPRRSAASCCERCWRQPLLKCQARRVIFRVSA